MTWLWASCIGLLCAACSDTAGSKSDAGPPPAALDGGLRDSGGDTSVFSTGIELRVPVPETGRVFVKLDPASVVQVAGDPKASKEWDVAFEGLGVYTNSGISGGGAGGSFGPLEATEYNAKPAPAVPFLFPDKGSGAFTKWYLYDGSVQEHPLYSRYHVVGVQDGDRRWKVQVLGYYGDRAGAPVRGLYQLRYAEVFADRVGNTVDVKDLDGTAADPALPVECLDLGTGERTKLSAAEARASTAWHLCVRRDTMNVNGGVGGPRNVLAADFDDDKTDGETLAQVKARTPDSEKARFDAVTRASFDGKKFLADRIVSAFGDAWLEPGKSPPAPAYAAWVAANASGSKKYLVGFTGFEQATATTPGTVVMRIKPF